jgi:hypothetical protein
MTYNKQSGYSAYTQEKKPVFIFRMVGIMHEQSIVVAEYCLAFFERNTMLPFVDSVLSFIPDKAHRAHAYSVTTV